jgi:hypothetical protein
MLSKKEALTTPAQQQQQQSHQYHHHFQDNESVPPSERECEGTHSRRWRGRGSLDWRRRARPERGENRQGSPLRTRPETQAQRVKIRPEGETVRPRLMWQVAPRGQTYLHRRQHLRKRDRNLDVLASVAALPASGAVIRSAASAHVASAAGSAQSATTNGTAASRARRHALQTSTATTIRMKQALVRELRKDVDT